MTVPVFPAGIRLAHEQDFLVGRIAGHQYEHRVGLGDAREVVEIAVLAEFVIDVGRVDARRGAEQHEHRLGAELRHRPGAAIFQILLLLVGERRAGEQQTHD